MNMDRKAEKPDFTSFSLSDHFEFERLAGSCISILLRLRIFFSIIQKGNRNIIERTKILFELLKLLECEYREFLGPFDLT